MSFCRLVSGTSQLATCTCTSACIHCVYSYSDHALTAFIQVDGVHQIMSTINVTHIATLRIVTEVLARVSVHVYAHITSHCEGYSRVIKVVQYYTVG